MKHIRPVGIIAAFSVMFAVSPVSYARSAPEDYEDDEYLPTWLDEGEYYPEWTYDDEEVPEWTDDEYDPEHMYKSALDLVINRLYWGLAEDIHTEDIRDNDTDASADDELPSSFDLRDVDGVCYVPEIKSQSPFGTCWSFGAIAASEISLAHDLGLDYNTMTDEEKKLIDLSEKHLAWFAYTALPEDSDVYSSQAGEGYYFAGLDDGIDSDDETRVPYNHGGFVNYASMLFSEGIGPALEIDVPYLNRNGKWEINISTMTLDEDWSMVYGDNEIGEVAPDRDSITEYIQDFLAVHPGLKNYDFEFDGPGEYYSYNIYRTESGDWSLDESQRFQGFFLKESNILPSPAGYGDEGYEYNEEATLAIKKELLAGRGVAVNIHSDQARPYDCIDPEETYLNFLTEDGSPTEYLYDSAIWAHYTYDMNYDPNDPDSMNCRINSNHAVCIVGYDDNFPKEYFNDPKGTIGGNGAWIVRNSWGNSDNSDITAADYWGNNGDGYFYVSYYDQSLNDPESYQFTLFDPDDMGRDLDIYDLFPSFGYNTATYGKPVYMANVFTAETKEVICDLGVMTAAPKLNAHFSVYLLNDSSASPTDGKKVAETEDFFEHMGYHTTKLDNKVTVEAGQRYSVVMELIREDGRYLFEINNAANKAAHDFQNEMAQEDYIAEYGSLEGYVDENPLYAKIIINRGESFLGVNDDGNDDWMDLADIKALYDKYNIDMLEMANLDYDNFPIRSYPYSDQLHVEHTIKNKKQEYNAGDVIKGTVKITNAAENITFNDICVSCTLTGLGKAGKIGSLAPGESRTINYSYTVTEEDLRSGELRSALTISCEGYDYVFLEEFEPESYVMTLAEEKPAPAPVKFDAADKPSAPSGSVDGAEASDTENPDTGTVQSMLPVFIAIGAAIFIAAIVFMIIVAAERKK